MDREGQVAKDLDLGAAKQTLHQIKGQTLIKVKSFYQPIQSHDYSVGDKCGGAPLLQGGY